MINHANRRKILGYRLRSDFITARPKSDRCAVVRAPNMRKFAMIVVVEKYNAHKYSHLIEKMYRLRAHIFHDRLGWDLQVVDGKERDKYDDEEPVYIIHTDDKRAK